MKKQLNLIPVVSILVCLITILLTSLLLLKLQPHMPLVLCLVVLAVAAKWFGYRWEDIEKGFTKGISVGIKPILILALVGMLIAIWMMSGTVPFLLYKGLGLVDPSWYAVSALLLTIIVSTFTGSSFTTIGTVGVALMGIGTVLGVHPGLCAGAIISGACFGDKMSPLSDTTNFAPAVAGIDLFTHIRHLCWTMVPSLIVTVILFVFLGEHFSSASALEEVRTTKAAISANFDLTYASLLSPLLVVILAVRRFPTVPAIAFGIISGTVTALLVQDNASLTAVFQTLQNGFVLESENDILNGVVNRGGLQSMMGSISLIMIALALGGLIEEMGLFTILIKGVARLFANRGHLISSTALSSIGVNLFTGEQYLSILLPGQTLRPFYEQFGVPKKTLSRTLEDAGTLVNPLIPWGVSGAFFASTLNIAVLDYLPFVFFLYFSPLFTIIIGYAGSRKRHYKVDTEKKFG